MKKLIIIIPNFKPGGAERVHVNLANYWSDYFKIYFFVMKNEGSLSSYLRKDIHIIDSNVNKIRDIIIPLSKTLKEIKPDIILSAMWPLTSATLISKLISFIKCKIFFVEHCKLSGPYLSDIDSNNLTSKLIIKITYFFANKIICVSNCVKKDLLSITNLSEKKFSVIYNPIVFNNAKNYDRIKYLNYFDNAKYKILGVGTLKKQKDFKTLILAFSLIAKELNAKLIIVGDGPEKSTLNKLILNLNMNDYIKLVGFQNNTYPWFDTSDLYVHSAIYDGLPLTILEALLSGTNIVSTNSECGPYEILDNGKYGDLVEVGNSDMLSKAIKKNLLNPKNKNIMLKRAKYFSLDRISNLYIDEFNTK